jgi:oligopeptide transport system substrate-binding protein
MTSHDNDAGARQGSPSRFLNSYTSPNRGFSRRDAIRAGALLTGAAMIPVAVRASSSSRTGASRHAFQGDAQTDIELTIPLDPFGEPLSLDPHRAVDWGPNWVTLPYVWSGLLAFDQNGAVVPDLAEEVVPGDDASVWTATLRENLRFASGTAITAQHFIDSWLRALDPANLAPMAMFMAPVAGYDDYIAGTSTELGFEAVDDRTIEIRLKQPLSYFPSYLATFVWAVIDLDIAASDPANFPLLDSGAGQWRFTEFVDNDYFTMEQNPNYWDGGSPSVTRIVWPFMDSIAAGTEGLDLYRQDAVASLDVPLSLVPAVQEDDALAADLISIASPGSTISIGLDFNQPPFNDVRIRQAIAASIDTTAWATDIWEETFVPATSFTPPSTISLTGYEAPPVIAFDANRAKDLVAQAEFQTGDAQTEVVYYQPASDSPEDQERHAALLQMITTNSGITITHDTSKTSEQIAALQSDLGGRQFDLVWWWASSDTPCLLSKIGQSTSPFMAGWFNWAPTIEPVGDLDPGGASSEFDRITGEADQELDLDARNSAYAEAEKILLDNAVYIPLGYWVQRYIQKPWLQGTRQGPWTGRIPVRIDKDVTVSGKPE